MGFCIVASTVKLMEHCPTHPFLGGPMIAIFRYFQWQHFGEQK